MDRRKKLNGLVAKFCRQMDWEFPEDVNAETVARHFYNVGREDAESMMPRWKRGTPPHKGWWLTRTLHEDGLVTIACETFHDDEWPHEGDINVLYMDMNELINLPKED